MNKRIFPFAAASKIGLLILSAFISSTSGAQVKTTDEVEALYQRVYNYGEDKMDSIGLYAEQIKQFSDKTAHITGKAYAQRLKGIMYEYKEDFENSLRSYQSFADYAEQAGDVILVSAAISDEAGIYMKLKQYETAKKNYFRYIDLLKDNANKVKLAKGYTNLGIVYRKQENYDSALICYNISLKIREAAGDKQGAATVKNNIGSLLVFQNRPAEALPYFMENLKNDSKDSNVADQYYDYSNVGSAYIGLGNYGLAEQNLRKALQLAEEFKSTGKQAETYEILTEMYKKKGDLAKAFEQQEKVISFKAAVLNEENNNRIAELQEKYNAKERQQENNLLVAEVKSQQLEKRNFMIAAIAAIAIALLIGFVFFQIRRAKQKLQTQNDLIQKQNEKLADLNEEKNALISVVSHDLSSPFASIRMWNGLLQEDEAILNDEQRKAIKRINSSVEAGENLIRNVLAIEKAETNRHRIELENFNVSETIEATVQDFSAQAAAKKIRLLYNAADTNLVILSDAFLVKRICENLISNAIKYTLPGKCVFVSASKEGESIKMVVRDEGPGIAKEELPRLFKKYGIISNKPTAGEDSTGLGLSIVKRIVDELSGAITVESELGKGSSFIVML